MVAAAAVGGYFVLAGGDDKDDKSGSSSNVVGSGGDGGGVKDDGPHKLTTPETVLTEYKKNTAGTASNNVDLDKAEAAGVKNPKDVGAQYKSGSKTTRWRGRC